MVEDLNPVNFWNGVFDSLPTTQTDEIAGHKLFKIPLHEAVYLCQLFLPTKEQALQPQPMVIAYGNNDWDVLTIPPSCALSDEVLNWETGREERQLNPLFSPPLISIARKYPEFFADDEKFLFIHELGTKESIRQVREELVKEGVHPSQLLILRMEPNWATHERGTGTNRAYASEALIEYLTSAYFRSEGYLVDKFSENLLGIRGAPDLYAIYWPPMQSILEQCGFGNRGLYLCELEQPLWKTPRPKTVSEPQGRTTTVVIEAESSRPAESSGHSQLRSYLNFGEFHYGYVAAPFIKDSSREDVGIITVTNERTLYFRQCPIDYSREEELQYLLKRVERVAKLTLLIVERQGSFGGLCAKCQAFPRVYSPLLSS